MKSTFQKEMETRPEGTNTALHERAAATIGVKTKKKKKKKKTNKKKKQEKKTIDWRKHKKKFDAYEKREKNLWKPHWQISDA